MSKILLTNDDGYNSIGFYPLLKEISKKFSVTAVAPLKPKSWIGKAVSGHSQLSIKNHKINQHEIFTVDGTPADCVQVGLYEILKNKPKLVVSGINIGPNTGHGRILSSGTIGAGMEAVIDGVRAIASSLVIPKEIVIDDVFDSKNYHHFEQAALITVKIVSQLQNIELDKSIDIVSINIPYGATAETDLEITMPHRQPYGKLFDIKNGKATHHSPDLDYKNLVSGTDLEALHRGKVSVTPINLDLVSKESLAALTKHLGIK